MKEQINLYQGDCLEVMDKLIEQGIKVDAIITDPPYGTTACKWDSIIPFDAMWERLNALIKDKGAMVFTTSQPFTTALVYSNIKNYRHEWIWKKNRGSNFALLKYQPFKEHETIVVFGKKAVNYYPIKEERSKSGKARCNYSFNNKVTSKSINNETFYTPDEERRRIDKNLRNPSSVQIFNTEVGLHPTQKPIALMEYLIKTYTNENEVVLDFTMGSGSTGVAAKNLNRKFIGIELDEKYFEIAKNRINK